MRDHAGDDGRDARDADLVRRVMARDADAARTIITTHNRRLYHLARGLTDSDSEAEDIVQEAYVNAFAHIAEFRGDSALSTWLSRIVVNEALGRLRRRRRAAAFAKSVAAAGIELARHPFNGSDDAERTLAQRQILGLVEQATDALPLAYRVVFVARAIDGLSNDETAELLGLRPETVRTRLHRARLLVRRKVDAKIGPVLMNAFPFAGQRCARLTAIVMDRLSLPA